ncbi:MAG: hypothetical protein KF694_08870 [Mesorhizobium sp.]|nr:hypothetical protein [Mesorhizobium sp.]
MTELVLTEGEEAYFREMRSLSTDADGRAILAGLTVDESVWLVEYRRRRFLQRSGKLQSHPSEDERRRAHELDEKHERVRLAVIGAEHILRTESPTRN